MCRAHKCKYHQVGQEVHSKGLCLFHYNSYRNNGRTEDAIWAAEKRGRRPKGAEDWTIELPDGTLLKPNQKLIRGVAAGQRVKVRKPEPKPEPKPQPVKKSQPKPVAPISVLRQIQRIREAVQTNRLERVVSTRFIADAKKAIAAGFDQDFIIGQLTLGWSADEKRKVNAKLDEFDDPSLTGERYVQPKGDREHLRHESHDLVKRLLAANINVMLYGPSGTGKTFSVEKIADELHRAGEFEDLPFGEHFGVLSCNRHMNVSDLLGRWLPLGEQGQFEYQISSFIKVYRDGGVFLLDEFDSADPGVAVALNSALANGWITVPGIGKIHQHKNCRILCATNTLGRGADRLYAGRNQLDESTLDRFRMGVIGFRYDSKLEEEIWAS